MAKMSRRSSSSSEDEGGGANWMDTYGDMVTLLLTFFVFLFSFSTIDASKWQRLVGSFTGASFSVMPAMDFYTASEPPIQPIGYKAESQIEVEDLQAQETENMENFQALLENMGNYIEENNVQAQIVANMETKTLILRFADNVLFASGSASILPAFTGTMEHIITMLDNNMELIGMVRVEGHTDNVPIHTDLFEDNWDLSGKRATNVLRYIIESGRIDTARISVSAYGQFHPVADNGTTEGRAANRRVDFVIESVNIP